MNSLAIHLVCAARPNFMKIAPLYHALKKEEWAKPFIVHTGQHYDLNMSDVFFKDLNLSKPNIHLGVGSGSHAEQTGKVMMAYERVLMEHRPDLVIVVGDVNSTMACTLAASKIVYPISQSTNQPNQRRHPLVAHLEAGLRSFDRSMPEEINRMVTDRLADFLWTPSLDANENLINEGTQPDKIQLVGNIMIDSLEMLRNKIEKQNAFDDFGLKNKEYGLVTIHRPSNVDEPEVLRRLCNILLRISKKIPLIFPIHPRTRKNLEQSRIFSILENSKRLFLPDPLNYVRFMNMLFHCRFVITDSGGIQEETTYLNIPCLTVRPNTERPITITHGTNQLCELNDIEEKARAILSGYVSNARKIEFWDGRTAERTVEILRTLTLNSMVRQDYGINR